LIANNTDTTRAIALLRSTTTIRERAAGLLARARSGQSDYFNIDDSALPATAKLVAEVTRTRYPVLAVPYHSRWRHFEAGGVDRLGRFNDELGKVSVAKRARAQIDLVMVSVLLDAGSGPEWHYLDARTGQTYSRSEGLGVASFNAFTTGLFSSKPTQPCQADAAGLQALTARQLGDAFQVAKGNPLVGLEGRAALLRRLGEGMATQPEVFGGAGGQCRPGRLYDHLLSTAKVSSDDSASVAAHDILSALLTTLSAIWPAQNTISTSAGPIALGDCWQHPAVPGLPGESLTAGWMPFHKLSQWLTYSLLEPFEWAGVSVTGLDALTGLPEYRNGGLLLDTGVIRFKDPAQALQTFKAGDIAIVEWRALTVALLDELAPLVRTQLGLSAAQMPLACVLEGGTWAAGRQLAQQRRNGTPPLNIESDGTVF
jgi:Protein of unknown function (DUF1688)